MVGDGPIGAAQLLRMNGRFPPASRGRRSSWNGCAASLSTASIPAGAECRSFPRRRIPRRPRAIPGGCPPGPVAGKSPPPSGRAPASLGSRVSDVGFEKAVFVEAQAALDGALAHDDVVLLAAGEIGQGERKFRVADHAQIRLDAARQNHAGLGLALGRHAEDARLAAVKKSITAAGCFEEASKSMSPMTSLKRRKLPAVLQRTTSGMRAQTFQDRLGRQPGRRESKWREAYWRRNWMPSKNVGLRFFAEAVQLRHFARPGRPSPDCSIVSTPSLSCSALTFFGPRPGMSSMATNPGGIGAFEFLVIGQLARLQQFADLVVNVYRRCL